MVGGHYLAMDTVIHLVVTSICLPNKMVESRLGHLTSLHICTEFIKGDMGVA